jgi:hypothetical protein
MHGNKHVLVQRYRKKASIVSKKARLLLTMSIDERTRQSKYGSWTYLYLVHRIEHCFLKCSICLENCCNSFLIPSLCSVAVFKCCTRAVVESWASCLHLEFTSEEAVVDDALPENHWLRNWKYCQNQGRRRCVVRRILSVLTDGEAGCCWWCRHKDISHMDLTTYELLLLHQVMIILKHTPFITITWI